MKRVQVFNQFIFNIFSRFSERVLSCWGGMQKEAFLREESGKIETGRKRGSRDERKKDTAGKTQAKIYLPNAIDDRKESTGSILR
jgi:hypothetical protein